MKRVPAYEGKNSYIFVSYAHKDSELVLPMITELYNRKYRVWYDEGIVPGSEWPHNIETHLKGCSTALIYISRNSLASANCENEVVNAIKNNKRIIQYSLDGSLHPLIEEKAVSSLEELMNAVSDDLIGDGTGYDVVLRNRRRFSIWNVLLGFSIILFLGLIFGVYGLNKGYFDDYLPGRNISEESIIENKPQEGVKIDNDVIAQAILEQLGQEDLFKPLEFLDEEDRKSFLDAAGLWGYKIDGELNYYDLTTLKLEEIELVNCSDECLKLLKYLPELKTVTIDSGKVSDLESLNSCAKLESVYVNRNCFPLNIPQERRFELLYKK